MKQWKIWLGVVLIFSAGLCIGSVGTGLVLRHKVMAFLDEGPPATQRLLTKRLTRKLDLSPQQQQQVAAKIAATQERILSLRGRYQPEAAMIIRDGVMDIRQDLSPEQQEKLDRLYREMRGRLGRFRTH